jgi:hypothetical protein
VVPVNRNLNDFCGDLTLVDVGVSCVIQRLRQEGQFGESQAVGKVRLAVQMVDSIFGRIALDVSSGISGVITEEDVLCTYLERRKISRILDDLSARDGEIVVH